MWSGSRPHLERNIKSHLFDHHSSNVSRDDFRVKWDCPYCVIAEQIHDRSEAVQEFQEHLYEHVESTIQSGVHVADEVDNTGQILVKGPIESPGANNARVHFLSAGDIAIIVTNNPEERLQLLDAELQEWPSWTIVITSKRRPLAEELDINFSEIPIELIQLDQAFGPSEVGETISRVLSEHNRPDEKVSLEFDILSEIIAAFDLNQSVSFVKMLTSRLEEANALSQFYIDPAPQSSTILNVIEDEFDLEIETSNKIFSATE